MNPCYSHDPVRAYYFNRIRNIEVVLPLLTFIHGNVIITVKLKVKLGS